MFSFFRDSEALELICDGVRQSVVSLAAMCPPTPRLACGLLTCSSEAFAYGFLGSSPTRLSTRHTPNSTAGSSVYPSAASNIPLTCSLRVSLLVRPLLTWRITQHRVCGHIRTEIQHPCTSATKDSARHSRTSLTEDDMWKHKSNAGKQQARSG